MNTTKTFKDEIIEKERAAGDITGLLKELQKLRWDCLTEEKMREEWAKFFNAGNVPEFYLHTLAVALKCGQELQDERMNRRSKVIKAMRKI